MGQTYETDASLILYPAWSHKRYTITYELNGGELPEGVSNPAEYTVESDDITLENPTKTGYEFKYWLDSEENQVTTIKKGSTGNLNLTAFWNTVKYSIVYEANGATLPDSVKNPQLYTIEDVITLPVLSRKGYTFEGWFDSNDNQVTEIPAGSFGDIVLTAKWNAVVYTVTYVTKNGANSKPNVNSYTVEDVAGDKVIELNPATRCGFKFEGWFKDDKFSGDAVEQIQNGDASDMVLYPKWSENTNLVNDFGAVKIYEDEDGLTCALMEGRSNGSVAINEDVKVSYVTFDRDFNANTTKEENKLSTVVLPFTIERNKVDGASFYKIVKVISEGSNRGVYISLMKDDEIRANTPYIIRPTKENLTFNIDKENDEMVTLNTSVMNNIRTKNEEWELRGVYSYKKWETGDAELGYAYGYTAKSTNKLAAGKFDINEAGAYIFPFRAYLLNISALVATPKAQAVAPSPFLAKSAPTSSASVENLIQSGTLDVFVVDGLAGENGGTTSIASERKAPARAKTVNGWYDMKGRRLNGKPTAKGIYYYNNKRIRIQ